MKFLSKIGFWKTIAKILLGIIIGMYLYHSFFDKNGDSIEIGKYKIKTSTEVKGDENEAESKSKGFLNIFNNDED